jgi:oligopeptide/dipeptide ABC transporter ATP-binding protein
VKPPLLEVEDLHVWFDLPGGGTLHAVQGVSFSVAGGTRLGLVGESGCGKTTTILALMGLLPPTASVSGRVVFDGVDILEQGEQTMSPHRWKDIAMVFQGAMNAFDPVKRIGEQITEPMEHHGVAARQEAAARVRELLDYVGIAPDRATSYPHELSGGMRQRAAIAMALACTPRVLLADEPTTALDVTLEAQIIHLLRQLQREFRGSILFISHNLGLIAELCDHVVILYAGEVVEHGTVHDIFHRPKHPYTEALLVCDPARIHEVRRELPTIAGDVPNLLRVPEGCVFAPRCPKVFDRCRREPPADHPVGTTQAARCHLVTA